MMIQNSQMHQVVMNSLAVSALTSFGLGPSPSSAQMTAAPWHPDGEEEAEVFHYHYVPCLGAGALLSWPVPVAAQGPAAVRYLDRVPAFRDGEVSAVPPPPPPSATGTVGASVPPASEYYDLEEGRL
ncbi:proline-rich protein 29 [Eudromia elegans]